MVYDQSQKIRARWMSLKSERESWMGHWQELAVLFNPRGAMFLESNQGQGTTNRGEKKHNTIYDNSQLRSVDVLSAGLMAGMTSPSRPWFRLRTPDDKLNQRYSVRVWLQDAEEQMRNIFAQSNTYRAFRRMYEELGIYGTGSSLFIPDYQDVVRHYPMTVGEYAIGMDDREVVNTLYRQFSVNVSTLVDWFGYENCSLHVRNLYDQGNLLVWIPVIHAIEPRRERNPLKYDNQNMPWSSVYMELNNNEGKVLQTSGFRNFPCLIPRWKVNGHDVYGESPAMRALGDVKQLQQEQYRKSQAIDYQTQPPLQVPSSLVDAVQKGPGSITVVDNVGQGIKAAWDVELNLQYLLQDIMDVRQRVSQAMFEDIFLMFTSTRRGVQPPTAEEIAAQQEEKLLMIGPVLENLHDELLTPIIEKTFSYMIESGILPPAPPELSGKQITVKYVSVLAQAQKLVGLSSLDRMVGTIVNLAQIKPEAIDKLDTDKVVDYYADTLGVDPDLIVADDKLAMIRTQRAQQQQQMTQAAAAPEMAKAAKDMGDTNVSAALSAIKQLGG